MKKLFFAAVFAVVAVGGAFATTSNKTTLQTYYYGDGEEVECSGSGPLCSSLGTLYEDPEHKIVADPGNLQFDIQ